MRHERRALALLSLALVLAMTTWFSASAVLPQLRDEWVLSDSAAAWLTIAVQVGFVAGALGSSVVNLADIASSRTVILAGSAGAAAANLGLLAADGPRAAISLRLATGFFLAGVYPPALKLIATWFRSGRGTALGIVVGALTVGSAGPHLVNGVGGLDWRFVVAVTSALTVAGGIVARFGLTEGPYPFPTAVFDARQIGRALRNRGVRLASLGYFGHMWELYAMWAWFLVFFRDRVGGGSAAAFATFAAIGIGGVGCWAGGVLGDRWGRAETTAAMMAVSGACALAIGLAPERLVLAIGLVWGFAHVTLEADQATIRLLTTPDDGSGEPVLAHGVGREARDGVELGRGHVARPLVDPAMDANLVTPACHDLLQRLRIELRGHRRHIERRGNAMLVQQLQHSPQPDPAVVLAVRVHAGTGVLRVVDGSHLVIERDCHRDGGAARPRWRETRAVTDARPEPSDLLVAPARLARLLVQVHRRAPASLQQLLEVAQQRGLALVARLEAARQLDLVEPQAGRPRQAGEHRDAGLRGVLLGHAQREPLDRDRVQAAVAQLRAEAGPVLRVVRLRREQHAGAVFLGEVGRSDHRVLRQRRLATIVASAAPRSAAPAPSCRQPPPRCRTARTGRGS